MWERDQQRYANAGDALLIELPTYLGAMSKNGLYAGNTNVHTIFGWFFCAENWAWSETPR